MSETPIEDFIREAAVWVEKDGQTYFEMVMNTVHELERRFTTERRRAEDVADNKDAMLTVHILRNWDREKLERFCLHLLGDKWQTMESLLTRYKGALE